MSAEKDTETVIVDGEWTATEWMMATTFREVIRGVRRQLIEDLSVTDLLIVDLLDRRVLTDEQYRQLLVRNTRLLTFTM